MNRTLPAPLLDALGLAGRGLLAVTFALACWHKIADPASFALQVATYQLLPLSLINLWALTLPWIELVLAGLLLAGFWTRPAALVSCALNLIFIVAIALALQAELHLQCGCHRSESG